MRSGVQSATQSDGIIVKNRLKWLIYVVKYKVRKL